VLSKFANRYADRNRTNRRPRSWTTAAGFHVRNTTAVFGGVFVYDALTEAAKQTAIPIQFLLSWDDPEISRRSGLELFDAFAWEEKVLLTFPGRHFRVPVGRIDTRFFPRYLGWTDTSPA
jgi:fermentation-respiration switch protein FrsA (DUF1100 family)